MNRRDENASGNDPAGGAPDVETVSDAYAARFSGPAGEWMLEVQEKMTLAGLCRSRVESVLDVGGGHGQLARPLCREGYEVTVAGSSPECRRRLDDLIASGRCRFATADLLDLPFPDRSFDCAISFRLLTHCPEWEKLVGELCRVARRAVIVDYPHAAGIGRLAPVLYRAKDRVERGTRPWRPLAHGELERAFARHGYRPASRRGEFFFPMALHRLVGSRPFSAAIESPFRASGLTGRWGSPVILEMISERE